MSANGKAVVFYSDSSTLDGPDGNFSEYDVFRRDVKKGTLAQVSRAADGTGGIGDSNTWGACLSSNGKYVAFASYATNFDATDTDGVYDTYVLKLGR